MSFLGTARTVASLCVVFALVTAQVAKAQQQPVASSDHARQWLLQGILKWTPHQAKAFQQIDEPIRRIFLKEAWLKHSDDFDMRTVPFVFPGKPCDLPVFYQEEKDFWVENPNAWVSSSTGLDQLALLKSVDPV